MTVPPLIWQRGVPSTDSQSGDDNNSDTFVIPNVWASRSRITNELVHAYQQVTSLDLGIDYAFRVQTQYPWRVTSQTPVLVISSITEGRP